MVLSSSRVFRSEFLLRWQQLLAARENGTISQWNLEQKFEARTQHRTSTSGPSTFTLSAGVQMVQQLVTLKVSEVMFQLWILSSNQELKVAEFVTTKKYYSSANGDNFESKSGKSRSAQEPQRNPWDQNIYSFYGTYRRARRAGLARASFSGYTLQTWAIQEILAQMAKQLAIAEDSSIQQLNLMNHRKQKFRCEHEGQIVALTWKLMGN
jgi:hypothetical protein